MRRRADRSAGAMLTQLSVATPPVGALWPITLAWRAGSHTRLASVSPNLDEFKNIFSLKTNNFVILAFINEDFHHSISFNIVSYR